MPKLMFRFHSCNVCFSCGTGHVILLCCAVACVRLQLKEQGKVPPPPPAEEDKKEEDEPNFKPFVGKGYSLRG